VLVSKERVQLVERHVKRQSDEYRVLGLNESKLQSWVLQTGSQIESPKK